MRATLKKLIIAVISGAVMVTGAWAGASLMPVKTDTTTKVASAPPKAPTASQPRAATPATDPAAAAAALPAPPPSGADLPAGQVLAGAAKLSIAPRPDDYDGYWETDYEKCATLSAATFTEAMEDPVAVGDHMASTRSPWPENPNCIYQGGFGLGPMNPATAFDEDYGVWVRSVAFRDKQGDDLVMTIIDGEGYFWDYATKCDDCGIKQLTEQLAADQSLGLEAKNIIIAATHSHAAPEFIGGWGFVPDWYMKQVSETITLSIRKAMEDMVPATLEVGEHLARPFNSERRDTYRSAEEQHLAWLRASKVGGGGATIATIGAYAAHPTAFGNAGRKAHPDWPGLFEKALEDEFGGVGLQFMTGLGNMSNSGLKSFENNQKLAGLVTKSEPIAIDDPDIRTNRTTWHQPVTNAPLTALGAPGFFDREFVKAPSSVRTGKTPDTAPCVSASAVSAEIPTSAARIGDEFALTASPGEIFSNVSNTIKERSGAAVTMPIGQANDALGYIPQSFEMNPVGQQGLGFAVGGLVFVNYEDSYSIDRCFGDMALETAISLVNGLKPNG